MELLPLPQQKKQQDSGEVVPEEDSAEGSETKDVPGETGEETEDEVDDLDSDAGSEEPVPAGEAEEPAEEETVSSTADEEAEEDGGGTDSDDVGEEESEEGEFDDPKEATSAGKQGKSLDEQDLQGLTDAVNDILSSENVEKAMNQTEDEDVTIEESQQELDKVSGTDTSDEPERDIPSQPDIFKNLNIPSELSSSIDQLFKVAGVEKISWKSLISKKITTITGVKVISNDQLLSRRIPGAFGAEEDLPHYRSILVMFDISGSMSFQLNIKSLKVISELFKGPTFKETIVWVGHYSEDAIFKKLNRYSKSRFMERSKAGFSRPSGGTMSLSSQLGEAIRKVRPLPDFIINLTDGEYRLGDFKESSKKVKLFKRMITVIIGSANFKKNFSYQEAEARFRKNYILGSKR